MRLMKYLFTLLLVDAIFCSSIFAQDPKQIFVNNLRDSISSFTSPMHLKDSVAVYAFSIKVSVSFKDKRMSNHISYNNKISELIFDKNFKAFIEKVDFRPLLAQKKKAEIIIPLAYIVANYKVDDLTQKNIGLNGLPDDIYKLFNATVGDSSHTEDFIFLKPIVIVVDKAIYN